jgi:hypothetical protein
MVGATVRHEGSFGLLYSVGITLQRCKDISWKGSGHWSKSVVAGWPQLKLRASKSCDLLIRRYRWNPAMHLAVFLAAAFNSVMSDYP